MPRLAILTSGGDSPGTNAAIESAVRHADRLGLQTLGVRSGFAGLAEGELETLTPAQVDGISARGGTVLGTSRDRTVGDRSGRDRILQVISREGIDGVIVLGGDGSIRHGATALEAMGVTCAAIPCTIDNDVPGTDRTLGFDTACNRAIALADAIRDTAQALPGRMFVLETLGGNTGFIALAVAEAVHADLVLLPEYPLDLDYGARRMRAAVARQGYALAVASEGAGDVPSMASYLAEAAGHRVRLTSIGHAQRGGAPSFLDRWLAERFAAAAVSHLGRDQGGSASPGSVDAATRSSVGVVAVCRGYDVELAPLAEVIGGHKQPDHGVFQALNGLAVQP
ncbi:MAG: 6-phosphofructokinase [Anaerolineae bacterium]|nr:6-phosphofructokinase [Anaerolineae bacterium]